IRGDAPNSKKVDDEGGEKAKVEVWISSYAINRLIFDRFIPRVLIR
ncbi:hypothetical protein Trydic_g4798, partial [Trypoxylus dichotomus]